MIILDTFLLYHVNPTVPHSSGLYGRFHRVVIVTTGGSSFYMAKVCNQLHYEIFRDKEGYGKRNQAQKKSEPKRSQHIRFSDRDSNHHSSWLVDWCWVLLLQPTNHHTPKSSPLY